MGMGVYEHVLVVVVVGSIFGEGWWGRGHTYIIVSGAVSCTMLCYKLVRWVGREVRSLRFGDIARESTGTVRWWGIGGSFGFG